MAKADSAPSHSNFKKVIVVGGSSGIGAAIADVCASNGQRVLTMQRTTSKWNAIELDLRWDQDTIGLAVAAAIKMQQGIDWLVLSGGVAAYTLPLVREEQIVEMIRTNYIGPRLVFNAFLKELGKGSSSRVLYIGSTAAQRTGKALEDYAASKAAAETYFLAAGRRFAKLGIRCNVLAPGWVESPMSDALKPELAEKAKRVISLHRFAQPTEIADMAYSILDGPDYMTGDRISISGGL